MKPLHLVITCEHAVNTIPQAFTSYFSLHEALLSSHRGYDIGALGIAQTLATSLDASFFHAKASRLLIDNNRSLSHPDCFSFITQPLPLELKQQIIQDYYQPYRTCVLEHFKTMIALDKTILHLSIHSFTPIFNERKRHGDLCLLYDPSRTPERDLALQWSHWLKEKAPDLTIRRNYPYLGKSDGFASTCRKLFTEAQYIGFEIESNQAKVGLIENQERFGKLLAEMLKGEHGTI